MHLHTQLPKVPCPNPKSLDASRHKQFKASFTSLSAPAQRPFLPASFRSQLPMSMHSSSARDRTHALAVCHTYMTASFYTLQALSKCQMLHHRWHVMLLSIDSLILHVIILFIVSLIELEYEHSMQEIKSIALFQLHTRSISFSHNTTMVLSSYPAVGNYPPPPVSPFGPLPSPSPRIPLPSWDARHLVASLFLLVHFFSDLASLPKSVTDFPLSRTSPESFRPSPSPF
ncbi:hypothetical protein HDV62DRAFT_242399 [Trichoderma sp. SZMC 28011]